MPHIDRNDDHATRSEPGIDEQIAFLRDDLAVAEAETWAEGVTATIQGAIASLLELKRIRESAGGAQEAVAQVVGDSNALPFGKIAYLRKDIGIGAELYGPEVVEALAAARERADLAESRLKAMTEALREPTNETLGKMMNTWENAFGSPYTRYVAMLNVAADAALLREAEGEPTRDAMAESIAAQIEAGSPGPDWQK